MIRVRIRVRVRVRVRVRAAVTELVYQIGFTTLFRSQGEKMFQQQAAASSSSKQLSSFLPIRICPSA